MTFLSHCFFLLQYSGQIDLSAIRQYQEFAKYKWLWGTGKHGDHSCHNWQLASGFLKGGNSKVKILKN